jgi:hypothetical protein
MAMPTLRGPGGAAKLAQVYKHFTMCAGRRMGALAAERQYSFACNPEAETMSGQYVSDAAVLPSIWI